MIFVSFFLIFSFFSVFAAIRFLHVSEKVLTEEEKKEKEEFVLYKKMSNNDQRKYLFNKYYDGRMPKGFNYSFKGFNEDMTCYGGFQYREKHQYSMKEPAITCERGFHSCYFPRHVEKYYRNTDAKYHLVYIKYVDTNYKNRCNDSKIASRKIIIGPEIPNKYFLNYV